MHASSTILSAVIVLFFGRGNSSSNYIEKKSCPRPGFKKTGNGDCIHLNNNDVLASMKWLTSPPSHHGCKKLVDVEGIRICRDPAPVSPKCIVWSVISMSQCDDIGDMLFEKRMSSECDVTVFQFVLGLNRQTCSLPEGLVKGYPRLRIVRRDTWAQRCYSCFYKMIDDSDTISVTLLKLHSANSMLHTEFDGVQYSILADLFLHAPQLASKIEQIVLTISLTPSTLVDNVGREAEQAWNMWASREFLKGHASVSSVVEAGSPEAQPRQFRFVLDQLGLNDSISYYHHTMMRVMDVSTVLANEERLRRWVPNETPALKAVPPAYCRVPFKSSEDAAMQTWIATEMRARCHPFRLAVSCDRTLPYEAFVPCRQDVMNHLAEDYAAMKGWCDFKDSSADIEPFTKVDAGASEAFQKPRYPIGDGVRFAFLLTVYADAPFVKRLLSRIYSPDHYYLLHIDPAGSKPSFETEIRREIASKYRGNMFVSKDIPIVYGASTATILLTRSMAWFLKYASGWDYMIPITGSDYPLVPLSRFEHMLRSQRPPMPFVMAWTPGTSTHIFRLQQTHPVFDKDPLLKLSVKVVTDERGDQLGAVPMEFRSGNFGPPLFCNGQKNFYHLDNRRNKSGTIFDTQWLFPRDVFRGRGRAYAEYDPKFASASFDGGWRIWKKSDPATTGAYDRETVEYIVNSEEGKKYFHFFKNMLLGSEEHYYVSLLYNWERTRSFVQTLSAQIVWNTWELGLWESSPGFQTHTHFLSEKEFEIMKAFSKRGMVFARKFSTAKTSKLLDMIDEFVHLNKSTDAGSSWPGYFAVDITSPGKQWKQWLMAHRQNLSIAAAGSRGSRGVGRKKRLKMLEGEKNDKGDADVGHRKDKSHRKKHMKRDKIAVQGLKAD